jgi:hypothetical protein
VSSCVIVNFALENVGSSSLMLDRVSARADIDLGFGTTTRHFDNHNFNPPLDLAPGARYEYLGDNCSSSFPGSEGSVVVIPNIKVDGVGGAPDVTDIHEDASYGMFNTEIPQDNPDLMATDIRLIPGEPVSGENLFLEIDVENVGAGSSAIPSSIEVYPEGGGTIAYSLGPMSVGQTVIASFDLGVHADGVYSIAYYIDPFNLVFEENKSNNTGSTYYSVPEPSRALLLGVGLACLVVLYRVRARRRWVLHPRRVGGTALSGPQQTQISLPTTTPRPKPGRVE